MSRVLLTITGFFILGLTLPLQASPERVWRQFVEGVGKRDALDVLGCYTPRLRKKFQKEKQLSGHMFDMFGLVYRDYRYKTVKKRRSGDRATLTLSFQHRQQPDEKFECDVVFVRQDGRWWIDQPPELPASKPMIELGDLDYKLIAGIGVVVVVILAVSRKFFL